MVDREQSQEAGEGAVAIQSGRDTLVTTGFTTKQMDEIISALCNQLPAFAAIAREVVDARMQDFKEHILRKFSERDKANSDAFSDPDFQYLLGRAQHAFARSGEEVTRDTLVDLIAKRSKEAHRSRMSLTLNEAVEKAAVLTPNEFSELSLSYFFGDTVTIVESLPALATLFSKYISPLLDGISRENASYQYLVAQSCATISIGATSALEIIRNMYGGLFSKGFQPGQQFLGLTADRSKLFVDAGLVTPCLNDPALNQIAALNEQVYKQKTASLNIADQEKSQLWANFTNTFLNGNELRDAFGKCYPDADKLIDLWETTPLRSLQLTTIGTALGYANLARLTGFDADLTIWIK